MSPARPRPASAPVHLVGNHSAVRARLQVPTAQGFLLLAAEVGTWRGPFPTASALLTKRLAEMAPEIDAREATVFQAVLRPPGEGAELLAERGIPPARYDVVVLIRTASVDAALASREDPAYRRVSATLRAAARRTHEVVADNVARLGDVDHSQDHAFLFNYFYADDRDTLLQVWEHTAGWFQARTALANSWLMRPLDGEPSDYGIVNHASWPTLRTFLPSLLLRPSFRSFVLSNFKANGIAAQPIIYRRARPARTA